MKQLCWLVIILMAVTIVSGCGKRKETHKHEHDSHMEKPEAEKEKVKCSYDGMEMYMKAFNATMEHDAKMLYFCTKEEKVEFGKDPEGYLSGKKKGKMKME